MALPKFNPFRPGSIVTPGMFSGREDELFAIQRCLIQAKGGNPRHFLIEGERGIGKSSLLLFAKLLAAGELNNISRDSFKFLVLDTELNSSSTDIDLIEKLGRSLRKELVRGGDLKTLAKGVMDFLSGWKILGVEYKREKAFLDPIEAIEELALAMSDLLKCAGHILDGILILVDEADKPDPAAARLGEVIKLLTERLTRIDCDRVCVGLAGLPVLLSKLRASHESSPRIFETLTLGALSVEDRHRVIRKGLEMAKERNKKETGIDEAALQSLAHLSEGYPHFLQEFAYASFEEDGDDLITTSDVQNAVFKEGGAIYQLGKRYFEVLYYEKISSPDYRKVLQAMAENLDGWLTRQDIIRSSGIRESQVNNALNTLKSRNIIIANEEKKENIGCQPSRLQFGSRFWAIVRMEFYRRQP